MISLGIESTAHTFGVGVVDSNGKIIKEKRDMFIPELGSGFIPNDLADHHNRIATEVLKGIDMDKIDIVSFSQGPGIPNALMVGSSIARYISSKYKKHLVGVNHAVAHIEIGKLLTKMKDPVVVYLSGGNTQVIAHTEGRYRVFGESEDIPVGNLFDVFARDAGLKMPGGPEVERLAKKGKFIELPYVVKGMDLSFTGLLTAAKSKAKKFKKEDVCYSLQETAFAMLTEVSERALAHTGKRELLLVGGVAANKRLYEMMSLMCKERGAVCKVVPFKYAGDNGVNIAWTGILARKNRDKSTTVDQNWRVDQVKTKWLD